MDTAPSSDRWVFKNLIAVSILLIAFEALALVLKDTPVVAGVAATAAVVACVFAREISTLPAEFVLTVI